MKNRGLRRITWWIVMFGIVALFIGCSSTPKVSRVDTDTTIDVSGRWNDADSRMVSDEMIQDCLDNPWLERFRTSNKGKPPTIVVGMVRNKSHEHINVETFMKDLERALINSGRVQFVASKGERGSIRDERLDMAKHASEDTMKGPGEEVGADFMLIGSINTIRDEAGGTAVMYYQVDLELINMANNIKAWIGQKKIKKVIQRSKLKW